MKIVGCDLHTRYQQIAMLEEETDGMFPAFSPNLTLCADRKRGGTQFRLWDILRDEWGKGTPQPQPHLPLN